MRAAVFKEMGKPLAIEAIADLEAGPSHLILKVKNCGICGSDLHMTEPTSVMPLALGSVMGHEFAGEVVEVGKNITHLWKPGDRAALFEPSNDKVYRHPTFFPMPDEVKHLWKPGDRLAGFPFMCCGDFSPCANFGGRGVCGKGISIGLP